MAYAGVRAVVAICVYRVRTGFALWGRLATSQLNVGKASVRAQAVVEAIVIVAVVSCGAKDAVWRIDGAGNAGVGAAGTLAGGALCPKWTGVDFIGASVAVKIHIDDPVGAVCAVNLGTATSHVSGPYSFVAEAEVLTAVAVAVTGHGTDGTTQCLAAALISGDHPAMLTDAGVHATVPFRVGCVGRRRTIQLGTA